MTERRQPEQHDEHEHAHRQPRGSMWPSCVALLVLTGDHGWRLRILKWGVFNPIVALAIAVIKAMLVVLFFMHVKYSTKLTKLTVGAGVFTFLVLIGHDAGGLLHAGLGTVVGR